jgi:8-oxo-dGTP diphosphatase
MAPEPPREWLVAGALVESDAGLLLVRNQRRGGWSDWSTPGGVIDAADASLLEGLAREVEEETGIRVRRWEGPLYEVRAVALDLGWSMRCEVHRAVEFEGELRLGDPDGIVVDAMFVPHHECPGLLDGCARWVAEPLGEWLDERWNAAHRRDYRYEVIGTARADLRVERAARP